MKQNKDHFILSRNIIIKKLIKNHAKKIRFIIVGSLNTLIDFAILLTLTSFDIPAVIANYPSSTAAVVFSFFANKNYTFKSTGVNLKREIILFLIFTLFCAWVIQPTVIYIVQILLGQFKIQHQLLAVIAKIIATVITLIWNYLTYDRFVFNKTMN